MHRSRSLEPMRPKRKFREGAAPLSRKTFRRLPSHLEEDEDETMDSDPEYTPEPLHIGDEV